MRANVLFDDDDYIICFKQASDGDYELPDMNLGCINCYHLVDGEIVLDQEKADSVLTENNNRNEIQILQKKLNNTDYIVARAFEEVLSLNNPLTFVADIIKIMVKYSAEYKTQLVERKTWRARIEELQGGK